MHLHPLLTKYNDSHTMKETTISHTVISTFHNVQSTRTNCTISIVLKVKYPSSNPFVLSKKRYKDYMLAKRVISMTPLYSQHMHISHSTYPTSMLMSIVDILSLLWVILQEPMSSRACIVSLGNCWSTECFGLCDMFLHESYSLFEYPLLPLFYLIEAGGSYLPPSSWK